MEIVGLRWQDIDFDRKVIVLHETKNGEQRVIPPQGLVCGCLSSLIQFTHFKELNKKSETYAKEGISPAAVRFSVDIYVVA